MTDMEFSKNENGEIGGVILPSFVTVEVTGLTADDKLALPRLKTTSGEGHRTNFFRTGKVSTGTLEFHVEQAITIPGTALVATVINSLILTHKESEEILPEFFAGTEPRNGRNLICEFLVHFSLVRHDGILMLENVSKYEGTAEEQVIASKNDASPVCRGWIVSGSLRVREFTEVLRIGTRATLFPVNRLRPEFKSKAAKGGNVLVRGGLAE